jgi:raffinose/stachyose/melibiose transport system substrate-binding protein
MDRISRREFLALGAGAALSAAVSCTPGSSNGPAKAPPKPSNTGVTVTKPVTITVWDQETGKVKAVWDQLNKAFEQKNPNITVNRVNRSFGDLQSVLKLAIAGPHAPDVVEANQGWPDMGQMVKAGLLLPLDNYADAYGWFDRVPKNVSSVSTWTPDGKQFGTGSRRSRSSSRRSRPRSRPGRSGSSTATSTSSPARTPGRPSKSGTCRRAG